MERGDFRRFGGVRSRCRERQSRSNCLNFLLFSCPSRAPGASAQAAGDFFHTGRINLRDANFASTCGHEATVYSSSPAALSSAPVSSSASYPEFKLAASLACTD
jgi:hypothetical protein